MCVVCFIVDIYNLIKYPNDRARKCNSRCKLPFSCTYFPRTYIVLRSKQFLLPYRICQLATYMTDDATKMLYICNVWKKLFVTRIAYALQQRDEISCLLRTIQFQWQQRTSFCLSGVMLGSGTTSKPAAGMRAYFAV